MIRINENELAKTISRKGTPNFDFVEYDGTKAAWRKIPGDKAQRFDVSWASGAVNLFDALEKKGGVRGDLETFLRK